MTTKKTIDIYATACSLPLPNKNSSRVGNTAEARSWEAVIVESQDGNETNRWEESGSLAQSDKGQLSSICWAVLKGLEKVRDSLDGNSQYPHIVVHINDKTLPQVLYPEVLNNRSKDSSALVQRTKDLIDEMGAHVIYTPRGKDTLEQVWMQSAGNLANVAAWSERCRKQGGKIYAGTELLEGEAAARYLEGRRQAAWPENPKKAR